MPVRKLLVLSRFIPGSPAHRRNSGLGRDLLRVFSMPLAVVPLGQAPGSLALSHCVPMKNRILWFSQVKSQWSLSDRVSLETLGWAVALLQAKQS